MHAKYCCDSQGYQNYHLNKVGYGFPYFSGARYQQGYDLGNIFSSIAKTVLPLVFFFFFIFHIYPPFTRKRCIAMFLDGKSALA